MDIVVARPANCAAHQRIVPRARAVGVEDFDKIGLVLSCEAGPGQVFTDTLGTVTARASGGLGLTRGRILPLRRRCGCC